ncbi:MAG: ATP-binding protein [Desulforhopalus sp.]|jgi:anti-sigma regulatory factor (Ser/Thr protein kinase)|nr:ATP-binding protein [Desulforhopalus sp.]
MHCSLRIASQLSELKSLAEQLDVLADKWSLPKKCQAEINLILDELVTNIIEHGAAQGEWIDIALVREGQLLTMTISDDGPAFDISSCPIPDTTLPLAKRCCGGLGIHLVRKLTDSHHYHRIGGKNIVTLTKTLPKEGS